MKEHSSLETVVKRQLLPDYRLRPVDIGADANLSAKGFVFRTDCFEVEGVGHLCIMTMKAMAGLMKMETAVISPLLKDMPLINFDRVAAAGRETQLVEMYDTQIQPLPDEWLDEYRRIKLSAYDLKDYVPKARHAYDDLKYAESFQKTARGASDRLAQAADDYMKVYARQLREAAACSAGEKEALVRAFTDSLVSSGGPAVNNMKKLFGEETAERMIRERMYGI